MTKDTLAKFHPIQNPVFAGMLNFDKINQIYPQSCIVKNSTKTIITVTNRRPGQHLEAS
ncbi:hypothetical protein NRI_0752 [Neorickettsia risticii str. Illinois]|uniref:Uncharacterized protein n=1 Tax=Neorickettsia risticii (strain Illinois) TaxID=434131 RepID=C6V5Q8_NEORI|nr:hypothetical protein NRI_0752 [Neorickettsia risticii str. Illinois]